MREWLLWAGYTVGLLTIGTGVGGFVESRLAWWRTRRLLRCLFRESVRLRYETARIRGDLDEVAAYLFANEDEPPCDCAGIDEIVAANPQLADLSDKGWLLAQHDGERD